MPKPVKENKETEEKKTEVVDTESVKKPEKKYSVEVAPEETVEEIPVESTEVEKETSQVEETPQDKTETEEVSTPKPAVASFSLLDKDIPEGESTVKKPSFLDVPEETPTEKPADEPATPRNDQISSEEVKKWLKDVRPDTSVEVEKSGSSNLKKMLVFFVVLLLLGAAVGGFFYYKSNLASTSGTENGEPANNQSETTTTELTSTPTLTPTPEPVDLSKYNVRILNGSGITGEAAKVKILLTTLTFAKVSTGNADTSNYKTQTY